MTSDLQTQIHALNKRNAELENTVAELSVLVKHFEELFKLSQLKRFGASSEKTFPDAQQITLFGDDEPSVVIDKPKSVENPQKRRKQKGKRQEDLSKLPLEIITHEIPEEERDCPECGEMMTEIGVSTRDELKIIPAHVIHVQHRCKAYKCPVCTATSDKTPIIRAMMPAPLIKNSVASASAVAYIMTQKHLMHLPFYRLEQDFLRQGVFINRQNMAGWSIQVCEDWLTPIYDRLRENLLRHDVLHTDETTLQVLREPGKTAQQKSYMWLYRTGGDAKRPTILYEYQPGRGGEHPETFLRGWRGFCHTDGYSPYHGLEGVTAVGCWAHVRRKFDEAFKIAKASVPPKLEQKDIRILTEPEQQTFMKAVEGHRLEALYKLALATGMRRGELMALTWDCVDFKSNNIAVRGSISRVKDPDTGITALRFSEPKTKAGRRQVPILPNIVPVLKEHKERQDAEKAEAGSAWNSENLVFCSNVGTVIEPRRVCTTMDKITDAAGLPRFTFHALRHTFATRMLEANVPAKVVQDVLGHADVTLTLNTYSHVIGSTAHEQMAKINNLFQASEPVKTEPPPKESIKKQLDEAKQKPKPPSKQAAKSTKRKDAPEI